MEPKFSPFIMLAGSCYPQLRTEVKGMFTNFNLVSQLQSNYTWGFMISIYHLM